MVSRSIRIVYFGTPAYAVPTLRALAADSRYDVALVVTQPDRPAGRGRSLQAPAVKNAAIELGKPVYQPESLRTPAARTPLVEADADVFVVAAYGLIFGPKTLAIPRYGCLNLHASLLPKFRGASPVTAAILAGESTTGVTLMLMDKGLDTGAILADSEIEIRPDDTTGSLTGLLAVAGAELARESVAAWVAGEIDARPQPEHGASIVRPLVKSDGWIDWTEPAMSIERRIRAMQPWPRCWTTSSAGATFQVLGATVAEDSEGPAGVVRVVGRRVLVACGHGALELTTVQPAGSAEMNAFALVHGRKLSSGDRLGATGAPDPPGPLIREL